MKHDPSLPELAGDSDLRRRLQDEFAAGADRSTLARRYGVTYPTMTTLLRSKRGHLPKKIVRQLGYDVRERFYKRRDRKPKNGD
ncbi:MAG TPA: hypothetical protein VN903_34275 [Polyangia bacterium]|nr:hypothetical protein [Polyangia bacterium]